MRSRPAHLASSILDFRHSPLFSWFDLGSMTPLNGSPLPCSPSHVATFYLKPLFFILAYCELLCVGYLRPWSLLFSCFVRWRHFMGIRFTAMQSRSCADSNGIVSWGIYDGNSTNMPFLGLIASTFSPFPPCLAEKYKLPGFPFPSWVMSVGIDT